MAEPGATEGGYAYDVFICHASEDKARFVEPLVAALVGQGLKVWYDRFEIGLGDDPRQKVNEGLRTSRFGVVIVSPYSSKFWPQAELSALFAQEAHGGDVRILPVRCDLTMAELVARDPLLAGRMSDDSDLGWDLGVHAIARTIADRVRVIRPQAQPRSPLYNMPARAPVQTFVGRDDDVARVDAALQDRGVAAVSASVEGLTGVGKTELAIQLAFHLSNTDRYPGGIFWLDAASPALTSIWGGDIADQLKVPAGPVDERARLALGMVARHGRALIVLDNVVSWTHPDRPAPLPRGPNVHLLVTTQHLSLGGPNAFRHVELTCLSAAAARKLLVSLSQRDDPDFDPLLEHLAGHTLAVELAGAYLATYPATTATTYLARLQAGTDPAAKVSPQVAYARTVEQALAAVWERLDAPARRAWQIASVFAPAEATVELFTACGVDEDAQRTLRQHHLISSTAIRWTMHRLVRAYGERAGTPDDRMAAQRAFIDGCCAIARGIDFESGHRVYRTHQPHLTRAIDTACVVQVDSSVASGANHILLDRVGVGAHSSGDLQLAKVLLDRALDLALKSAGQGHPAVASARSNLALVLRDLGELERARFELELALESDLATYQEGHPSVAVRRGMLGTVLLGLGDLASAKELLEKALAAEVRQFGDKDHRVAMSRSNLAGALRAIGDLHGALWLIVRSLATERRLYGEGHPSVATSRSNLAGVLVDLGFPRQARLLLERALASDILNFGDAHPRVVTSRANLATVLLDLGEFERAEDLLAKSLASARGLLGDEHPEVARCLFNRATMYDDKREYGAALQAFAEALAIEERTLGAGHPSTAYTRARLAAVLLHFGQVEAAQSQAEAALRDVRGQPAGSRDRVSVEQVVQRVLRR